LGSGVGANYPTPGRGARLIDSHLVIRTVPLGLLCLLLFLLLFPLTLGKPGLPPTLKADEGAYYLMARSLAEDGDLRYETRDGDRIFEEFPFIPTRNVILMSDDGWRSVYFGKPYIYSLFAAPFAGLFGANGMVFFNMLLLVAMVGMGAVYLGRFNPPGRAALASALFFLLSAGFVYVFWIHTEIFNMAAVTACLFFLLHPDRSRPRAPLGSLALSGAALALAVYNKPMILAVGLAAAAHLGAPLLRRATRTGRAGRAAAAWVLGFVVCLGLVAGLATALTGHPSPYLGVRRQGVTVCDPGQMPRIAEGVRAGEPAATPVAEGTEETEATDEAGKEAPLPANAWGWLLKMPKTSFGAIAENLGYFFWGRHAGLLLYMPFALVAVGFFFRERWRRRRAIAVAAAGGADAADAADAVGARWALLLGLVAYGLFFLLFISWNWQGGGGFVGNRYFVNVYPAFLFLMIRIEPRWPLPLGSAVAGLFLAPILLTPLGVTTPEPTLQVHTRNAPFRWFPLELSLRNVPGYHRERVGDLRLVARKDQVVPLGERFWVQGAGTVEILLLAAPSESGAAARRLVFRVATPVADQRVTLRLGGDTQVLDLPAAGQGAMVTFSPSGPDRWTTQRFGVRLAVYRLEVSTRRGALQTWTRQYPPEVCPAFAYNASKEETFLTGVDLLYLGDGAMLNDDVFQVGWGAVEMPETVTVGERFVLRVRLMNRSAVPWSQEGAARVKLSYHWRDEEGAAVVWDGLRTELPGTVAAGGRSRVAVAVEAPAKPGRYTLELDPLLEHVGWFSERGGQVYRATVEVVPAGSVAGSEGVAP